MSWAYDNWSPTDGVKLFEFKQIDHSEHTNEDIKYLEPKYNRQNILQTNNEL